VKSSVYVCKHFPSDSCVEVQFKFVNGEMKRCKFNFIKGKVIALKSYLKVFEAARNELILSGARPFTTASTR